MGRSLKIRLHIISPVHIGCDDVYEPMTFVINERTKKLIAFDPIEFMHSLHGADKERFASICSEGTTASILKIYKFLSNREVKGREVDVTDDFLKHFNKVKTMPIHDNKKITQELNRFSINRTAYNPYTNLPYIPGSSLKGALRTAYLSKLAKEYNVQKGWERYLNCNEIKFDSKVYNLIVKKKVSRKLEKDLLHGDFTTDPFRMIKVSDFMPIGDVKTKILYAVNKKKKPSKFDARGPFQILETINGGTVFEGIINVIRPPEKAGIKHSIRAEELLKAINSFFIPQVNSENKTIERIDVSPSVVRAINNGFKGRIGKTAFLIRLGRHSGAEAVTIEGNRWIKIMQGKSRPPKFSRDGATTIWLASETRKPLINKNLIPFGWTVMEIIR